MISGTVMFRLDLEGVRAARATAAELAQTAADAAALLADVERAAEPDAAAVAALYLTPHLDTDVLLDAAARRRRAAGAPLETFAPLYLTNECDAACAMCGMRATNESLRRETADADTVDGQLAILHRRGLRGVAILTGEYRHGKRRDAMIARAAEALRRALARGFEHVLVNIGALEAAEYPVLLAGVPRDDAGRVDPRITMCTFQETYDPDVYARFMGTDAENPRSHFERRLTNFDRARDAGMWAMNPGVLLGLHKDPAFEIIALLAHVRHLAARGCTVYVSVPRLRRANDTTLPNGLTDDQLCRAVAALALGAPRAQVVISTREPAAMQRRLLPVIGVLTPGSPGVAPYTETGARFELEASQFEVLDHRPFEAILGDVAATGVRIACWEPAA
jgi:2-iminoacetate synthase